MLCNPNLALLPQFIFIRQAPVVRWVEPLIGFHMQCWACGQEGCV